MAEFTYDGIYIYIYIYIMLWFGFVKAKNWGWLECGNPEQSCEGFLVKNKYYVLIQIHLLEIYVILVNVHFKDNRPRHENEHVSFNILCGFSRLRLNPHKILKLKCQQTPQFSCKTYIINIY